MNETYSSSILVIEDSKSVREGIADALKRAALCDTVIEACDGLEGFKRFLK